MVSKNVSPSKWRIPFRMTGYSLAMASALLSATVWAESDRAEQRSEAHATYQNSTPEERMNRLMYKEEAIELSDQINAGDDFYQYVNQHWIDQATIPTGRSKMNAFVALNLETEQQIQALIDQIVATPVAQLSVDAQNIRALYLSYLDEAQLDALGLTPLDEAFSAIEQAQDLRAIVDLMAQPIYRSVIAYGAGLDAKEPDRYRLHFAQGGLGLPNRNYYLDESESMAKIRSAYLNYITTLLTLAGDTDASASAEKIMAFETALAKVHWSPEMRRDAIKNYQPKSLDELMTFAPEYPWQVFFERQAISPTALDKVIVRNDDAVQASAKLIANTEIETLKRYLKYHLISDYAYYLSAPFYDAKFAFYKKTLNGIETPRPRKEQAIEVVNLWLPETLGKMYVETYFDANSKETIRDLITYITGSFHTLLANNAWMDAETIEAAQTKLAQFGVKVAYPDQWHDLSELSLNPNTLIANLQRIEQWSTQDERSKIGQAVRAWEWSMPPQMVNAYFSPLRNEIVFPAAILQAPFFDPNVDPAYNFGAIGAVIGHEMGHGFDDQGRLYDGTGQLREWWTATSKQKFDERTAQLVTQYNQFEIEGLPINGQLTLGENIGDLGGLTIALAAYKEYVKTHYSDGQAPIIDGTTGLQRFFISWARTWRELSTAEAERNKILTDPHSPNRFRVNGIVRNMDDWYEAFSITPDHALYLPPNERVKIW